MSCGWCQCENGWVWDNYHGEWRECSCRCHGRFCPICERQHPSGVQCKLKRSRVARERATERMLSQRPKQ